MAQKKIKSETKLEKKESRRLSKQKQKEIEFEEYEGEEEHDEYDGPDMAAQHEFNITKDPRTGKVPRERILDALDKTKRMKLKTMSQRSGTTNRLSSLTWTERGPFSDVVGPSNGNTRANSGITAGRVRAVMVDSSDQTKKTVWVGGVDGGLWKTTDITTAPANWILVNDFLSNLAVTDICQDPTNYNIMYFCTGEAFYNSDAVKGNGVFKSTDNGVTWTQLSSTNSYGWCTRIICDFQGNVYLGTRGSGLLRSTNGGTSWTTITPSGMNSDICDIEISSTSAQGRLHVVSGIFSTQTYRFTDIPATVTSSSGWTAPTTAFTSASQRAEIGCRGNVLYALPVDASYQVPTIFKSTDGGANWTATGGQPTAGWASKQGWYSLAIEISPVNPDQVIVGGLDTWKTTNGGASWSQLSYWVGTSGQYVHADLHKIIWYDGGNKLIFGCDGGIHYSSDGGTTIRDRNSGLRIKQFYSCAIHPTNTNMMMAGAQDNGTHLLNGAGLTTSVEVTGGDGAFVAIDQNEPQYMYGSYVFNTYRRSSNTGSSWSAINFFKGTSTSSSNFGSFINPFDYDDANNVVYASADGGEFFRWTTPQSTASGSYYATTGFPAGASIVTGITAFNGSRVSTVKVSPYTSNRVYFGTAGGRITYLDNANTAASSSAGVNITQAGMPSGTVSSINVGTTDQFLIATYSNYGVNNVWVSTNGGTSWTAIDGTLPDMPVRGGMFFPGDNTKAIIATETGVLTTDLVNGSSTVWDASTTFPVVRTDMIRYRSSDGTLVAGTHGRGLWTTTLNNCQPPSLTATSNSPLCVGQSLNITATCTEPSATYSWTGPNGFTSTVLSPSINNVTLAASGTYTLAATFAGCTGFTSVIVTVNPAGPSTSGASICLGGSGSLTATTSCSGFIFTGSNTQSGAFNASTNPTAARLSSINNSTACSFDAAAVRNYVAQTFQVSTSGIYTFEMDNNAAIDGMGYIVSGAFVPGNCAGGGTFLVGDDDGGSADEPLMTANLTAGVTYTLISTTYGSTGTYTGSFGWTVTPPASSGGQYLANVTATTDWYTAATGGTSIGSGTSFNPVGVSGSGLANTNTAGTTVYFASCSYNPGCRTATNFIINTKPTKPIATITQPTCSVASGTITVTSSLTGLSFSIDGSTYTNTTGVFSGLASGNYVLTSRNANGCISDSTQITITNGGSFVSTPTANVTQPTCSTASGTITVTSSLSGLTFSIDGSTYTNTTGIFTGLSSGTYNLTARNSGGCTSSALTLTVNNQPPSPTTPTASIAQPTCSLATGTVSVTSTIIGLNFSIDGTTYTNTTGVFSGLTAGTYNLTARNSSGCISSALSLTLNAQPSTPAAPTASVTQPSCSSATGTITVTSALTGLTFSINFSTYTNTTGVFTGVASGNYNLTCRNSSGCTSLSTSITINANPIPAAPTISVTQPSCSVATGAINITSGVTGLTFSIDGVNYTNTTGVFSTLTSGSYNVTAKSNSTGCISSATVATLNNQPTTPSAPTASVTQPTCNVSTGNITVTSSITGLTFSISGSGYTNGTGVFTSVGAGTYPLTARNSSGCTSPSTLVTVNTQPTKPVAPAGTGNNRCDAGVISISATPGAGQTIDWYAGTAGGTALLSGSTTYAPTISATTTYYAEARNTTTGCVSTTRTAVVATVRLSSSSSSNATACESYLWNGVTYTSSGTYTFTTTNAVGCDSVATLVLTINQPTASTQNTTICTTALPYSWNGSTYTASGNYTKTFVNAKGCDSIATLSLTVNYCGATVDLNLKLYLQGYYTGSGNQRATLFNLGLSSVSNETDSIQVNLWSPTALGATVPSYSKNGVLLSNGNAFMQFPGAAYGNSYYIAVKHRNSIETWSKNPVLFSGINNYDFTTNLNAAYSNGINPPMKLLAAGVYGIYSGDVNQNGSINTADLSAAQTGASAFERGYNSNDCNGDGATDLTDLQIIENNGTMLIIYARP